MTQKIRHISISINAGHESVYRYVSEPQNLPQWAAGLAQSKISKSGEDWLAESPMGMVKIRFVPKNDFGVVDHDVTLPNGFVVHNPLRVLKNHEGAEVVFTLIQQKDMSDESFEADAAMVEKDLGTLKKELETK